MTQVIVSGGFRPKVKFPDPTPNYQGYSKITGVELLDRVTLVSPQAEGFTDPQFNLDECIISVSQGKNIVATPLAGRDGEVFEYISMASHEIMIRGRLASPYPDVAPDEAPGASSGTIAQLLEYLQYPGTITIIADILFQRFDMQDFVIFDYDFPQSEGMRNIQEFRIMAREDLGQEIIIKNDSA